jgi:type II secretory pathway pseudopilin PulG
MIVSPKARRERGRERGDTLIELLCAMLLIGIGCIGIIEAWAVSEKYSTQNRERSIARVLLANYADHFADSSCYPVPAAPSTTIADLHYCATGQTPPTPDFKYIPCATPLQYPHSTTSGALNYPLPNFSKWSVQVAKVEYWTGTTPAAFSGTCTTDTGLQRITLQVQSPTGAGSGVAETLTILKRDGTKDVH